MTEQVFLSVRQAAVDLFGEYTTSSRDRVYRFIDMGIINGVRDGRKWWIPRIEIERYRQSLETKNEGGS